LPAKFCTLYGIPSKCELQIKLRISLRKGSFIVAVDL